MRYKGRIFLRRVESDDSWQNMHYGEGTTELIDYVCREEDDDDGDDYEEEIASAIVPDEFLSEVRLLST